MLQAVRAVRAANYQNIKIYLGISTNFLFITFSIYIYILYSGLELLKKFKEEFNKYEKERQELANAEKLFDLPITMYQEMQLIEKELKGLELVYSIYERQKVLSLHLKLITHWQKH